MKHLLWNNSIISNTKKKEDTYMNYNIRGENIEVTTPIREYVEKRLIN